MILSIHALLVGCAAEQTKLNTLPRDHRERFASCRVQVTRRLCPDDRHCGRKAERMFAALPPESRDRWLADYGCSTPGPGSGR